MIFKYMVERQMNFSHRLLQDEIVNDFWQISGVNKFLNQIAHVRKSRAVQPCT